MLPIFQKLQFFYASYVLALLSLGYVLGELGHYLIGVTSKAVAIDLHYGDITCQLNSSDYEIPHLPAPCNTANSSETCMSLMINGTSYCEWNYNGLGIDYQILAGPSFIAVFTVFGVILGFAADKYNRVKIIYLGLLYCWLICCIHRPHCGAVRYMSVSRCLALTARRSVCEQAHYENWSGMSKTVVFICTVLISYEPLIGTSNYMVKMSVCTVVFAVAIILSGAVSEYWQLVVLRMIMAAGESACNPMATGILSDIFPEQKRALVMSIFNWGIYGGYGIAFPVGRYIPHLNLWDLGWRVCYYGAGAIAVIIAVLTAFTMREPPRKAIGEDATKEDGSNSKKEIIWTVIVEPRVVMLCLAASVRHCGKNLLCKILVDSNGAFTVVCGAVSSAGSRAVKVQCPVESVVFETCTRVLLREIYDRRSNGRTTFAMVNLKQA